MVAALAVGGVLLAVMIATSGYGGVILPRDARIPVHLGSHEHVLLVSKRAGLVIWPVAGAVVYGVLGGVSASSLAADWVPGVRDVLMPALMVGVSRWERWWWPEGAHHGRSDKKGLRKKVP
jgi:hypothetical protein